MAIRVAGIFITGAVTALGVGIFFTKYGQAISTEALLCTRALSAGAMLSVAIVHIHPESSHALASVTPFPLGGTLMLIGMVLAYNLEVLFGGEGHDHVKTQEAAPAQNREVALSPPLFPIQGPVHMLPTVQFPGQRIPIFGAAFGTVPASDAESGAPNAISSSKIAVESMEVGCVAHSIVLGIALGLQTNMRVATVLLIVFVLHQLLEAICLSHLIASLKSRTQQLCFCAATILSMPAGIVTGLIIWRAAHGKRPTRKPMRATRNECQKD